MSYFSTVKLNDAQTKKTVEIDSLGSLKMAQSVRLAGTSFENSTKDTNFWTETVTGSGTVTQDGEVTLATGTTADSTAKYQTNARARKVTGTAMQFRLVGRQLETAAANCIRRSGAYDSNNGYFFQYDGATFQVVSRKGGIDTAVSNGSFNGNLGATISSDETEFTRLVIEYTSFGAKFFVNGVLIHTLMATTTSLTSSLDLPVTMEVINENGNTADNGYGVLFATIVRLGQLDTSPIYKYIGTNTTTVCKYGAGILQRIVVTDNAGTIVAYDNTAGSGTIITSIDAVKTVGTLEFSAPFSNGLTIVSASNSKCTVVYE